MFLGLRVISIEGEGGTDNGLKVAATDSMFRITGIEGEYRNWEESFKKYIIALVLANRPFVGY